MKKLLIGGVLGALLAMPVHAEPTTMEQVLGELASLNERVGKLEEANGRLLAENCELRAMNGRLDASAGSRASDAPIHGEKLAEQAPQVAEAERFAKAAEWASRIRWKADMRYRHEFVDPEEAAEDQARHRIRARFGMSGKFTDTVSGTIQLATTGGSNDPRSTNQTLGEGWTRKGIGLDLAYVDWQPHDSFSMQLGKMPQPWHRVGSFIWDPDLTPEGIAAKYATGPFFASAFGYYLSERSTANDATLVGGQFGMTGSVGGVNLTGALGYYDVGSVEGEITTTAGGCAVNNAFFGGPQGNTTIADGLGCARLANDFNMIELLGQAELTLGNRPLVLFAHYMQNQEAHDLDSAYATGFSFGNAGDPHTWEFGYAYQVTEKDAQFGQFVDSDFGGGITDVDGSVFKFAYAPAKNWVLNGTYFQNNRFVDAAGALTRDYKRYQLDLNFKF